MTFSARSGSTVAEIDLGALRHNLGEIRRVVNRGTGILAAVKADAYGHGALEVSRALEAEGVAMLGVARIEEGIELRLGGIESPILVLSGVPVGGPPPFESLEERVDEMLKHHLTPTVFDVRVALAIDRILQARELRREAAGSGGAAIRLPYHLKIDTGMGRIGVPAESVSDALPVLSGLKHLRLSGAFTHFADADDVAEPAQSFTRVQIESFRASVPALRALAGENTLLLHAASSAGALHRMGVDLDLVRPGIALYGAYPNEGDRATVNLKPVMRLTTRVLFVKDVPAGTPVSYGRTFVTTRPTRIATLPVGYGDGYPRSLSNKGEVLVAGQRARVIGRVCMDLTMVDATGLTVAAGDEAVLIGSQSAGGQTDRISAEEVASLAGTISYEILTSVSKRVPRVYS